MDALTLAPFFNEASPNESGCEAITPLRLQIEWAKPTTAVVIPLFRYRPEHGPDKLRLEQIVFRSAQLPLDLECSRYQVVESSSGVFLPMEALLFALYSTHRIERPIFAVLAELTGLVSLYGSVRRPITARGLLAPQAEKKGFTLNTVIREGDRLFADIGWRPASQGYIFHSCLCEFHAGSIGADKPGIWKPPGLIGVAQLLSRELRQLIPDDPNRLFTPGGLKLLQNYFSL